MCVIPYLGGQDAIVLCFWVQGRRLVDHGTIALLPRLCCRHSDTGAAEQGSVWRSH